MDDVAICMLSWFYRFETKCMYWPISQTDTNMKNREVTLEFKTQNPHLFVRLWISEPKFCKKLCLVWRFRPGGTWDNQTVIDGDAWLQIFFCLLPDTTIRKSTNEHWNSVKSSFGKENVILRSRFTDLKSLLNGLLIGSWMLLLCK